MKYCPVILGDKNTPPKTNMSPKKGRHFNRKYIWTNHWFSGGHVSFPGSKPLYKHVPWKLPMIPIFHFPRFWVPMAVILGDKNGRHYKEDSYEPTVFFFKSRDPLRCFATWPASAGSSGKLGNLVWNLRLGWYPKNPVDPSRSNRIFRVPIPFSE